MHHLIKTIAVTWFFTVVSMFGAVQGLINTGTDLNGMPLSPGSQQPGWSILSISPLYPAPNGLSTSASPFATFVVDPYIGNSSVPWSWLPQTDSDASKWISYSSVLWTGGDILRSFTYHLGFNASSTDFFQMRLAADQNAEVYLNSISPENRLIGWGAIDPGNYTPFNSWSPWITVSGLNDGQNSLLFVVGQASQDYNNPTGLRVEFSAIPEPATVFLLMLGLLAYQTRNRWQRRSGE